MAVGHSAAFGATAFPAKSQVWTHAFCTWIEFTDGLVAQGQGVTVLHTIISALLNYLEAILQTDAFANTPKLVALSRWSPKLIVQ